MTERRDRIGERKGTPDFEFDVLAVSVGEAIVDRMEARDWVSVIRDAESPEKRF